MTSTEVRTVIYKIVNENKALFGLKGGVFTGFSNSTNRTKLSESEDIIVNTISGTEDSEQLFIIVINCFVNNIKNKRGEEVADDRKILEVERVVKSLFKDLWTKIEDSDDRCLSLSTELESSSEVFSSSTNQHCVSSRLLIRVDNY